MSATVLPGDLTLQQLVMWMKHYISIAAKDERIRSISNDCCDSAGSLKCVLKKVFDLIVYDPDPEINDEQWHFLWSVDQIYRRRKGNCHTYAIVLSAILLNCGYKPVLRFVSYQGKSWDHVFVVVNGIILDPTIGQPQDGTATKTNRNGPFFNVTTEYKEKIDFTLSRLVLVQGLNNESYKERKPIGRLRAKRLGMDGIVNVSVGQAGEDEIKQVFKDTLRLKWLSAYKNFVDETFLQWEWESNKNKIKNKGVSKVIQEIKSWYEAAAKGYKDIPSSKEQKAKNRISRNVSDWVVKTLAANYKQYGWKESIRRLKNGLTIPDRFTKIKKGTDLYTDTNLFAAAQFILVKYFWHESSRNDNTESDGVIYPQVHTRGDFGGNAKKIIQTRINWFIDEWAKDLDNTDSGFLYGDNKKDFQKGIPTPFVANLIMSEARERIKVINEKLPVEIDLSQADQTVKAGSNWLMWLPLFLGGGYLIYRGL